VKSAAAAVLVLAFAIAGAAAAVGNPSPPPFQPQADGDFCADKPTEPDARIASAVNAVSVSVATTPPIAILDTGISTDASEIGDRLVTPFDATTGGTDGSDIDGHGTEVAGIAAGAGGLLQGVTPTSPLMPVRIYNRQGNTAVPWMIAGINWAVQNHAAVINISSSMPVADASAADVASLTRAITDAFNKGTLVVASMGNDGNGAAQLPASLPHVIGVGASDLTGSRATFSNTGPWVDLVSPARSLVAPISKAYCPSGYGVANGSSFAAPAVAGAAALLAQIRPTLTIQQRFDVLRKSATDVPPAGRDDETGYGLLNVQNAMNLAVPPRQSSPEVDDDPYYVRGTNAGGHPTLLTRTRKIRLVGEVSPAKDPSDVYPVRIKKGERLTVSAKASGADALIALGLWKPTVGDFDVSNEVGKNEIVSTGGFADDVALKMDAKKSATYFVSVEAPDPVDPDDPTAAPPVSEPYQLVMTKTKTPKPKKKPKAKSKERTK
jgi:subtilisin family serine protease